MDIAAPGVDVLSTLPTEGCSICDRLGDVKYGTISGTSMATPHVSGVVALVRAAFPDKPALKIVDALINSALLLGDERDNAYGSGLVQAIRVLEEVNGGPLSDNPDAMSPSPGPPSTLLPTLEMPNSGICAENFLAVEVSLLTDDYGAESYWWITRDRDSYPLLLAIKWICRRVIVPGLVIVETSTVAGELQLQPLERSLFLFCPTPFK